MSGRPDDWAAGSRRVSQAEGRRTRRSDGRHARPRRSEAEDAPELSLPDLDDDDPTTLAEDAEWAAKLRPGRAPGTGEIGPVTSETAADTSQAPPTMGTGAAWDDPASTSGSWQMSTGPATGETWDAAPSDGTGEIWAASPSETTGDPWAPSPSTTPPATDPWASSPSIAEPSTGDWSPGIAAAGREPGHRLSDLRYQRPPAPEVGTGDPGTGSWSLDPDDTGSWRPETARSPGPAARPSWEDPPAATAPEPPYQATPTPGPPSARPWEPPLPRRPTPATPSPPASTGPDFGSIFSDLAQDRQDEAPGRHGPVIPDDAMQNEDPAVQAAHLEARRLIEHATGQLFQSDPAALWEQEEPYTRADEVAEPAANFGTPAPGRLPWTDSSGGVGFGAPSSVSPGSPGSPGSGSTGGGYRPPSDPSGYGLSPGPGVGHGTPGSYGSPGTSPGWSDPVAPPPVPDASTPYGAPMSFAPPGSAPADPGGVAPPAQTPGRALSPAHGRGWSADDSDASESGLWAPDRRADEDDSGGVGWLWSVEDHGASPQVPRSWVREMPTTQTHDVDGLARPIEGRRQRQLESRSSGRRVRRGKRWPVLMAVAAWVVLFAVVCWLYIFPWLEGILPENF
jgi:collagen type III alpha